MSNSERNHLVRRPPNRWESVFVLIFVALPMGCGRSSESTVQGTVTFHHEPLSSGIVTFHPATGVGATSYGQIQANGDYEIHTGRNRGLVAGDYVVTIVATEPMTPALAARLGMPKQITPVRYATPAASDLRCTVSPGANTLDFALNP